MLVKLRGGCWVEPSEVSAVYARRFMSDRCLWHVEVDIGDAVVIESSHDDEQDARDRADEVATAIVEDGAV